MRTENEGIGGRALFSVLEGQYRSLRAAAAEELHNAIVDALNEQRPAVETTLYVLEMVKAAVIANQSAAVGPTPAEPTNPTTTGWRGERDKKKVVKAEVEQKDDTSAKD